jgi:hypothetical protein
MYEMATKQETTKAQELADLMRAYLVGARNREPLVANQVTVSYTFHEQLRYMESDDDKEAAILRTKRNSYNWSHHVLWTMSIKEAKYVKSRLEKLDPLAMKLFLLQMGYLLSEYESMMEIAMATSEWNGNVTDMTSKIKSYSSRVSKIVVTINEIELVLYPKLKGA